jgi:outer membrane lipoprotein SlyB
MKSIQRGLTVVVALALAGCASIGAKYVPLVDLQGRDPTTFESDLKDCQDFAAKRINAEHFAIAGAIATGLLGAFLAPRGFRNEVAGRAAALGALGGAGEGIGTQQDIIKRCMVGRGYMVLN